MTLRLVNDDGELVREYESDGAWTVQWLTRGDASVFICKSAALTIYPSNGVTIEVTGQVFTEVGSA